MIYGNSPKSLVSFLKLEQREMILSSPSVPYNQQSLKNLFIISRVYCIWLYTKPGQAEHYALIFHTGIVTGTGRTKAQSRSQLQSYFNSWTITT